MPELFGRQISPEATRRVATIALTIAGPEYVLAAAAAAKVIQLADERGMLESELARPVKEVAQVLRQSSHVDPGTVLGAFGTLKKLGILDRVLRDAGRADSVVNAATTASRALGLANTARKFLHRGKSGLID